jgi:hypothetical protein
MRASEPWFVSQRAVNLAIVVLTRFNHVHVFKEDGVHRKLDLRVGVDFNKPGVREFGVLLKGSTEVEQTLDRYRKGTKFLREERRKLKDCIFPVALMVFDVTTDEGFFGWLLAPVLTSEGARLTEPEPIALDRATNRRIEKALGEVRSWYDARPLRMDHPAAADRNR